MELPKEYLEEMKVLLGEEYPDYLDSMKSPSAHSLRINTAKSTIEEGKMIPFAKEQVPWVQEGFYYEEEERPALHPYYAAGVYYLQEASAMTPGDILPVSPGDRILDLCAAPGGKSTQLAARLNGTGLLHSNDISASRARALLKNLEMAGASNIFVTAETPERLSQAMPEFFDKILVDAPCSGEGMFRRDPAMVKDWKEHGPQYYAPIQAAILDHAYEMLKPGGDLVYSTCTFSPSEDEEQIQAFLDRKKDMHLMEIPQRPGFSRGFMKECIRLWPHKLRGEGHFAAWLHKDGDTDSADRTAGKKRSRRIKLSAETEAFLNQLPEKFRDNLYEKDGQLYNLPKDGQVLAGLHYLRTGLWLGTEEKGRFTPSQALAMCLKREEFPSISLDISDEMLIRYLKGETPVLPDPSPVKKGYCLLCAGKYPLGWVKKSGNQWKNKYYPGWRRQS